MILSQKVQVHLWRRDAAGNLHFAVFQRGAAKGSYWQPITGNVEAGEAPDACARREAEEEAGIQSKPNDLTPSLWIWDWSRGEKQFAEHIFGLQREDTSITLSHEHQRFEWVMYAEALARFPFEGNRRGLALTKAWIEQQARE